MAEDRYIATAEDLTALANSIRVKAEVTGSLVFPTGFISAISGITTSDVVCKSGTYQPSEDASTMTIPVGTMNGLPLFYVVCANEPSDGISATYMSEFINYNAIFGGPITRRGVEVYGKYETRIKSGTTGTTNLTGESVLENYGISTAITPKAASPYLFSSSLTYSWFAIYPA